MTAKLSLLLCALGGFFSVIFGAFGAHLLKTKLTSHSMEIFSTAVHYQFFHALALGVVGVLMLHTPSSLARLSAWSFVVGIFIFSGSLYTLALTGQRMWGAITPFGGVSFLIGWLTLALAIKELPLR